MLCYALMPLCMYAIFAFCDFMYSQMCVSCLCVQLYVQQFQSDKDTRVAILSILAAGVVSEHSCVFVVVVFWGGGGTFNPII